MKITVKYFGIIAELTGKRDDLLELEDSISLSEFKKRQVVKYNIQDPESVQLAVNQKLDRELILKDGDEVAFLPPFAGG